MLTVTYSFGVGEFRKMFDYGVSIGDRDKLDMANSQVVMVNAEGKSLDKARLILANGIESNERCKYTVMNFIGDEARKIILNWTT